MPYIETTANIAISNSRETAIKEKMGKAIELIPGKSEGWLMLSFRENAPMYFRGTDEPCAICQVRLYGAAGEQAYERLTEALTRILEEELGIKPDRVYVTYQEISHWGWNGGNF